MDVAVIAKVAFTSKDRVRNVIRNFNADGFVSLYRLRFQALRASMVFTLISEGLALPVPAQRRAL